MNLAAYQSLILEGVEIWNDWRIEHSEINPDLRASNLSNANLQNANLRNVNLSNSILRHADLSNADLRNSVLSECDLSFADLSGANLDSAKMSGSLLYGAQLTGATLHQTDVRGAYLLMTHFLNTDLSEVIGIDECIHDGPSLIDFRTCYRSDNLSNGFLKKLGLHDWQIETAKLGRESLTNAQIVKILNEIHNLRIQQVPLSNPVFISYSHKDKDFVDHLEKEFGNRGIRYWRDIHHGTSGLLASQIRQAIQQNPIVLLVLSKNSISSNWVEIEVKTTREIGRAAKRVVLCPISLDNSWRSSELDKEVLAQINDFNVLDFSCWRQEELFHIQLGKLLTGLKSIYQV